MEFPKYSTETAHGGSSLQELDVALCAPVPMEVHIHGLLPEPEPWGYGTEIRRLLTAPQAPENSSLTAPQAPANSSLRFSVTGLANPAGPAALHPPPFSTSARQTDLCCLSGRREPALDTKSQLQAASPARRETRRLPASSPRFPRGSISLLLSFPIQLRVRGGHGQAEVRALEKAKKKKEKKIKEESRTRGAHSPHC